MPKTGGKQKDLLTPLDGQGCFSPRCNFELYPERVTICSDKTAEDIPVRTWLLFGSSQAGVAMEK